MIKKNKKLLVSILLTCTAVTMSVYIYQSNKPLEPSGQAYRFFNIKTANKVYRFAQGYTIDNKNCILVIEEQPAKIKDSEWRMSLGYDGKKFVFSSSDVQLTTLSHTQGTYVVIDEEIIYHQMMVKILEKPDTDVMQQYFETKQENSDISDILNYLNVASHPI